MFRLGYFLRGLLRKALIITFLFLAFFPKNWPIEIQKFIVWSAGITSGVRVNHLDLFMTHIEHESHFRQYSEKFSYWGFSFGPTLSGVSGDLGVGQISPIYHEITPFTRWSTFFNARQAAKYFAAGCPKEVNDCSDLKMISHYTGKFTTDPRVTNTVIAKQQNPQYYTVKYISVIAFFLFVFLSVLKNGGLRRFTRRLSRIFR